MQVGIYPTGDFATLEPSDLQLPFTETYISNYIINSSFLFYSTGQLSDPLLHKFILQSPVFLINSRRSLFCYS